jgi:hypothetical protein
MLSGGETTDAWRSPLANMLDFIIWLFKNGTGLLAKGGWRRFVPGYLAIAGGFYLLLWAIAEFTPSLEKAIHAFEEERPYLPWVVMAIMALSMAGLVSAVLIRIHLAYFPDPPPPPPDLKKIWIKPLWEYKPRALDRLHTLLAGAKNTLQDDLRFKVTTPDPIGAFEKTIGWAFSYFSIVTAVSRDIATGGIQPEGHDPECTRILTSMEALQEHGQKILSSIPARATNEQKAQAAFAQLDKCFEAIRRLQADCLDAMKRNGLIAP